jgi:hypothetical protein
MFGNENPPNAKTFWMLTKPSLDNDFLQLGVISLFPKALVVARLAAYTVSQKDQTVAGHLRSAC